MSNAQSQSYYTLRYTEQHRPYYEIIHNKHSPLACPLPEMPLWNAHPRVYLSIEKNTGIAVCPYCNTEYRLLSKQGELR